MKVLAAVLAVTVLVVTCEAGSKCVWGPSYWCQSTATAKECGKQTYCRDNVWKSEDVEVGSFDCPACKFIVNEIDNLLKENKTEGEVEAEIEKICDYLGPLASTCKTFIDDNFDTVWNELVNELDPTQVCTKLGLCGNSTMSLQDADVAGGFECIVCKEVAEVLDTLLEANKTEDEVKAEIEQICKVFGPLASECTKLIDDNFDAIWNLLIKELDPTTVCTMIGLCTNSTMSVQHEKQVVRADPPLCTLCDMVMHYMEEFVDKSGSENKTEDAIKKICNILPGAAKNECIEFVVKNFDSIWQLFKKGIDSDEICKLEFNCSKTDSLPRETPSLVEVGDNCAICKTIVNFLAHFVDNNSTEADVKKALETFCGLLPSISKECTSFVNESFDVIWALVQSEFNNDEICKQLKICPSASFEYQLTKQVEVPAVRADVCDICKTVASFLDTFVDGSGSEKEVKDAVEAFCKLLPGNTSMECQDLVDEYFDFIWNFVKSDLDSGKVCQQIGLCNSTLAQSPVKALIKVPTAPADLCSTCKLVASFLKNFVDANNSEDEVKGALEGLCKLLPGNTSTECTALVDKYFDMIWMLLKTEVDSGKICEQIGLCNSTLLSRPVLKVHVPLQSSDEECEICKMVMLYLEKVVDKNSTEGEVKDALEKFCALIQSNECEAWINKSFNDIWGVIKAEVDSGKVCEMIGACKNSTFRRPPVKAPVGSVSCTVCDLFVKFLRPFVDSNITETEAKDAVEQLCGYLKPTGLQGECTQLLDDYFPMIWKLLQSYVDDAQICKEIGLCSSFVATIQSKAPDASVVCVLCEFVMKELDSILSKNATEQEILDALDKVCSFLPSTIQSECDSLVKEYAPMILKLILQGLTPDQVCTALGLCTSTTSVGVATPMINVECVMCEFVMKEVDSMLVKNSTEKEIEGVLEKICNYLPATVRKDCDLFIETYLPDLIGVLVKEASPKMVCTLLKLCSNSSQTVALKSPKAGPLCILCEYVMEKVAGLIDGNSTEAEIEEAFEKVCSLLPSTFKDECDGFVKNYTKKIIDLLLKGEAPKLVCSLLHLCLLSDQSRPTAVNTPKLDECAVCKFTIQSIKTLIDSKAAQSTVEEALGKACDLLPKEISGECESLVEKYDPQIIQLLDQEIDPETLCEDVKLCKKTRKATNVLMQPWLKMARIREL